MTLTTIPFTTCRTGQPAVLGFASALLSLLFLLPQPATARPLGPATSLPQRRALGNANNTTSSASASVKIWIPVTIVCVLGIIAIAFRSRFVACLARRRQRSAAQSDGTALATTETNVTTSTSTAPTPNNAPTGITGTQRAAAGRPRRTRRPRRTPSQISTKSLPAYMEEPGAEEMVLVRATREDPEGEMEDGNSGDDSHDQSHATPTSPTRTNTHHPTPSSPTSHNRNSSSVDVSTPLLENSFDNPNRQSLRVGEPRVRPSFETGLTVFSSEEGSDHGLLQANSRSTDQGSEANADPRGAAPAYFEVVGEEEMRQIGHGRTASVPLVSVTAPAARDADADMTTVPITPTPVPSLPQSQSAPSTVARGPTARFSGIRNLFGHRANAGSQDISAGAGTTSAPGQPISQTATSTSTNTPEPQSQRGTRSPLGHRMTLSNSTNTSSGHGHSASSSSGHARGSSSILSHINNIRPRSTATSSNLLARARSRHSSTIDLSLPGAPGTSGMPNAQQNASQISLGGLSISAPLTHTLLRTEFAYPKNGPTPEQLAFVSSRESLGRFGVPFGADAVRAAAMSSSAALATAAASSSGQGAGGEDPPPFDFDRYHNHGPGARAGSGSGSGGGGGGLGRRSPLGLEIGNSGGRGEGEARDTDSIDTLPEAEGDDAFATPAQTYAEMESPTSMSASPTGITMPVPTPATASAPARGVSSPTSPTSGSMGRSTRRNSTSTYATAHDTPAGNHNEVESSGHDDDDEDDDGSGDDEEYDSSFSLPTPTSNSQFLTPIALGFTPAFESIESVSSAETVADANRNADMDGNGGGNTDGNVQNLGQQPGSTVLRKPTRESLRIAIASADSETAPASSHAEPPSLPELAQVPELSISMPGSLGSATSPRVQAAN
ncbi:hypothetical protein BOTBODRAFT_175210 [Botryobasidium botryosum FD-172 SS1]|uniref:Uncharacterized protein n=1 Tax=Botryobasidium botryosum (strain FD-172 SS1) TaxID=930990 RepID=A0A067MDZ9_BOTB1|nr:hypothetical protein BOTBODRAFT_175210 [Botryobasidium botryosum FD-172 SS1]